MRDAALRFTRTMGMADMFLFCRTRLYGPAKPTIPINKRAPAYDVVRKRVANDYRLRFEVLTMRFNNKVKRSISLAAINGV